MPPTADTAPTADKAPTADTAATKAGDGEVEALAPSTTSAEEICEILWEKQKELGEQLKRTHAQVREGEFAIRSLEIAAKTIPEPLLQFLQAYVAEIKNSLRITVGVVENRQRKSRQRKLNAVVDGTVEQAIRDCVENKLVDIVGRVVAEKVESLEKRLEAKARESLDNEIPHVVELTTAALVRAEVQKQAEATKAAGGGTSTSGPAGTSSGPGPLLVPSSGDEEQAFLQTKVADLCDRVQELESRLELHSQVSTRRCDDLAKRLSEERSSGRISEIDRGEGLLQRIAELETKVAPVVVWFEDDLDALTRKVDVLTNNTKTDRQTGTTMGHRSPKVVSAPVIVGDNKTVQADLASLRAQMRELREAALAVPPQNKLVPQPSSDRNDHPDDVIAGLLKKNLERELREVELRLSETQAAIADRVARLEAESAFPFQMQLAKAAVGNGIGNNNVLENDRKTAGETEKTMTNTLRAEMLSEIAGLARQLAHGDAKNEQKFRELEFMRGHDGYSW
eukprot:g14679.t1